MKKSITFIEYGERKIPITFNINVIEEIQEEYGSISEWSQCLESDDGARIKDLKFGIGAMVNEAIDILNEENGTDEKPMTSKQIGRMLTGSGMQEAILRVKELIIDSTKTEDDGKNE